MAESQRPHKPERCRQPARLQRPRGALTAPALGKCAGQRTAALVLQLEPYGRMRAVNYQPILVEPAEVAQAIVGQGRVADSMPALATAPA